MLSSNHNKPFLSRINATQKRIDSSMYVWYSSRDPNQGPHTCSASILPTKPFQNFLTSTAFISINQKPLNGIVDSLLV